MTGTTARGPVLIVEDDETLAGLLAHALEARGTTTEVVGSAEAAEARLQRTPRPGFVLVDVNLPGDSGWSLFRRGILGTPGAPPALITSAVPISPHRLREFNVSGYLPKPFSIEVLASCVDRMSQPEVGQGRVEVGRQPSESRRD